MSSEKKHVSLPKSVILEMIYKNIVEMQDYTKNNYKDLVSFIIEKELNGELFNSEYKKWQITLNYFDYFIEFYYYLPLDFKRKYIEWYANNKNISIEDVETIITYSGILHDIIVKNYDKNFLKYLNLKKLQLKKLLKDKNFSIEKRILSSEVSDENKTSIYDIIHKKIQELSNE